MRLLWMVPILFGSVWILNRVLSWCREIDREQIRRAQGEEGDGC